jgi:hypothetical protein
MKRRFSPSFSVVVALLLAACGSNSDPADDPCAGGGCTGTDAGASTDASLNRDASLRPDSGGSVSPDTGGSSLPDSGGGARVCMPNCQTNFDCASSCPTTQTYCCDVPTGTCYASASSTCVAPVDAGGAEGGLPYP